MNRQTMLERKRFARELAQRDAERAGGWLPPTPVDVAAGDLQRARMRRWWLDRYTIAEIREMGGALWQ